MKNMYCIKCNKYRKFEKPRMQYIFDKNQFFLLFVVSVAITTKKIFEEQESIEILKILGLVSYMKKQQTNIIILMRKNG